MRKTPSLFRCEPYATKMRREACALEWRRMNASRRTPGNGPGTEAMRAAEKSLSRSRCVGCEIGEAHARGEAHPDAPDVEVRRGQHNRASYAQPGGSRCPACGKVAPTKSRGHADPIWLRAFMHRCPHDAPCPGASDMEPPACCREPSRAEPAEAVRPSERELPPAMPAEEAPMAKKTYAKKCVTCSNPFEATHTRTLYCSDECRPAGAPKRPRKPRKPKRPTGRQVGDAITEVTLKPSGAQVLLEAVGYTVTEIATTPNGIVLLVASAP
jgi:hypothetical protein